MSSRGRGWAVPKALNAQDYRYPLCNTRRPWGVVTSAETGVPAAVPVSISFKARALPIEQ